MLTYKLTSVKFGDESLTPDDLGEALYYSLILPSSSDRFFVHLAQA